MSGSLDLCNGERVVVFLFVSRIILSVPFSLAYEAVALVLLAVSGLLVEISVEKSVFALDQFNLRSGGASGLLLATVTLPSLMLSRRIQMSRAVSNHEIGPQWVSYFNLQFWAACSCCFAAISFFYFKVRHNGSSASLHVGRPQARFFCMVFYGLLGCLSFIRISPSDFSGWYTLVNLIQLFCYGLTTVILLKNILYSFPSSASIGEALLVSNGLVLYHGDLFTKILSKLISQAPIDDNILKHHNRNEISTIVQGVLTCLLLFPMFYKLSIRILEFTNLNTTEVQVVDTRIQRGIRSSVVFYSSLSAMMIIVAPALMHFIEDFPIHPILWVLGFLFKEPLRRISLFFYWVIVLYISILRFYNISKNSKTERILLRKYYHLVAVLIFLPAVIFEPAFLDLAFGAALAVFLILEMIRVWKIWPFGHMLHQFMNAFTDHRDSEVLIVSHFSLLLGCAIPKWMSSGFTDRPLAPFAGILSLGIGDSMASMVGHKYGVLRWSKTGRKTVEGTAAGITSVLASCSILLPLLASTGYILSQHWLSLVVAVTITGLLEAYTAQLDNAFLPLVFYSLLCL